MAVENNPVETAFLVPDGEDYRLRWFTPIVEVPLCRHVTLAEAAVVVERLARRHKHVMFHSAIGLSSVERTATGYFMNFPSRVTRPVAPPPLLAEALGQVPDEVVADQFNYLSLLETADQVRRLTPDIAAVAELDSSGLIVTAPSDGSYDSLSRYLAPAKSIPGYPVTSGAHCALAPY